MALSLPGVPTGPQGGHGGAAGVPLRGVGRLAGQPRVILGVLGGPRKSQGILAWHPRAYA